MVLIEWYGNIFLGMKALNVPAAENVQLFVLEGRGITL